MATPKTIKIDVVSDFTCSWCYIGHIELERGIALSRMRGLPAQFSVQYHPFFLNSSLLDDTPITKEEHVTRKFGSLEKAREMFDMVQSRAKEEGLKFSFAGKIRQTTRAHRLLQKAFLYGGQDAQCALLRRIFRALFEDEQDIGDSRTLAKLASSQTYPFSSLPKLTMNGEKNPEITLTKSNMYFDVHADDGSAAIFDSEEDAFAWVEGTEFEKEVRSMSEDAARKGVTGVPFTVIDGRWAVSGCQKPECYYKIFEKLASTDTPTTPPNGGNVQKIFTNGATCGTAGTTCTATATV